MTYTAMVFFIELTSDQVNELNDKGWASDIGQAYFNARDGKYDAASLALFKPAARVSVGTRDEELVWTTLQNVYASWTERSGVQIFTKFPRSMDVGDILVWDDQTELCHRVASTGFDTIKMPETIVRARDAILAENV